MMRSFAVMLSLLLFLIVGCVVSEMKQAKTIETQNTEHVVGGPALSTIEYDGHKFIWAFQYLSNAEGAAGNLLHHPDCKCKQ